MKLDINAAERLAAFSDGASGGNPAGVVLLKNMPEAADMLALAAKINYSETAYAVPTGADETRWRVRYFSPKTEVPFCGHATIALTAALAQRTGKERFTLELNDAVITTAAEFNDSGGVTASLVSPPTSYELLTDAVTREALALFGWQAEQLDANYPPALIRGGATHLMLALSERRVLAAMSYDFDAGLEFMTRHGLVTIMAIWRESEAVIHARNAFAAGGVVEDPATGAAAAALTGYLGDIGRGRAGNAPLTIIQGEDMGMRSVITAVKRTGDAGVTVSGAVRRIGG